MVSDQRDLYLYQNTTHLILLKEIKTLVLAYDEVVLRRQYSRFIHQCLITQTTLIGCVLVKARQRLTNSTSFYFQIEANA